MKGKFDKVATHTGIIQLLLTAKTKDEEFSLLSFLSFFCQLLPFPPL